MREKLRAVLELKLDKEKLRRRLERLQKAEDER
jgi:hypothetical protein